VTEMLLKQDLKEQEKIFQRSYEGLKNKRDLKASFG